MGVLFVFAKRSCCCTATINAKASTEIKRIVAVDIV
jgi:hypothetical protein